MQQSNQQKLEEDCIVMTDELRDQLLRERRPPAHLFDFQVPVARDENLSRDWTPTIGDFSLRFDGHGVIYQKSFDGQHWLKAISTAYTKEYVQEMVHTGAWDLLRYDAEVVSWYFQQKSDENISFSTS